jgi:hypothetical protein
MNKLLITSLLFLVSCASFSGEWGPWKMIDVAQNKREWKFCTAELYGESVHHKGICYDSQECRYRKTLFGRTKSECRDKLLFCEWGDIDCLIRYDILDNIIIEKRR